VKLYPDVPARRARTIVGDLAALAVLLLVGLLAKWVYDAVSELSVLGAGVRDAGTTIEDGFASAAGAVDGVPLVGGTIADGLRDAGEGSGGDLAELGRQGEDRVHRLALVLGLTTFAIPAALLLCIVMPGRVRQVRHLTAAEAILSGVATDGSRLLLAQRAAFGLPYVALLPHTRDPLGDLEAGRVEPLIAAALDEAGVRPPRSEEQAATERR
jgi:hypothetical protein